MSAAPLGLCWLAVTPRGEAEQGPAVVGIADHRGWAVLLSVGARDGVPVVLDRRRAELLDAGLPSQPYHHEGQELAVGVARELVARVARSAADRAHAALSGLASDLAPEERLVCIALREEPGRPVPDDIASVLRSQAASIAADGNLYRDAICSAAAALGIDVVRHRRGEEISRAARALDANEDRVESLLSALGRALGPPWQKEHRAAAAAAIAALAPHVDLAIQR